MEFSKTTLEEFEGVIYPDMLTQFPPTENKPKKLFMSLLKSGLYDGHSFYFKGELAAYAFCAHASNFLYLLLDHFAVLKKFHSKGFGSEILADVRRVYKDYDGMLLEVEKPDFANPDTLRRIRFYERAGAQLMPFDTLVPHESGVLALDLYYLPFNSVFTPQSQSQVLKFLIYLYPHIYAHSPHLEDALAHLRIKLAISGA